MVINLDKLKINILREKILLIFTALSAAILIFGLGLIYFNIDKLKPPLVLHFDKLNGVDIFGDKINLWYIWFGGFFAVLLNSWLAETFFNRERVLTYLFVGVNVLLSVLVLVIASLIVSVN